MNYQPGDWVWVDREDRALGRCHVLDHGQWLILALVGGFPSVMGGRARRFGVPTGTSIVWADRGELVAATPEEVAQAQLNQEDSQCGL